MMREIPVVKRIHVSNSPKTRVRMELAAALIITTKLPLPGVRNVIIFVMLATGEIRPAIVC